MLLNFSKKFKNFILTGIISAVSLGASANTLSQEEQSKMNEIESKVVMMQSGGVLTKAPISYHIKSEIDENKTKIMAQAELDHVGGTCRVNIDLGKNLRVSYFGLQNIWGDQDLNSNELGVKKLRDLKVEYMTYHELAHCGLPGFDKIFRSGDEKVDELLNNWFTFSLSSTGLETGTRNAGLYEVIQENYADALSFIYIIKMYGLDKEVLAALQMMQTDRMAKEVSLNNSIGFLVHNTGYTLEKVLEESTLKKIMGIDNHKDLQELAINLANEGMWKSIRTYKENSSEIINLESLNNGAIYLVANLLRSLVLDKGNMTISNIDEVVKMSLHDSKIFLFSQKTAIQLYKELGVNNIKGNTGFVKFWKENKSLIANRVKNTLSEELGESVVFALVNSLNKREVGVKSLTLDEVKENGINKIGNIKNLDTNGIINAQGDYGVFNWSGFSKNKRFSYKN